MSKLYTAAQELIHSTFDSIYGDRSPEVFEGFMEGLSVFLTALTASDEGGVFAQKYNRKYLKKTRRILRQILEKSDPWDRTPHFLMARAALFLRYDSYGYFKHLQPSLDFGCGDGFSSSIAFSDDFTVGVDLMPTDLVQSREFAKHGVSVCASGHYLPLPNDTFRTVVANHVLYHIPDKQKAFREIYRVMKPGGHLYFDDLTERLFSTDGRTVLGLARDLGSNDLAEGYKAHYQHIYQHGEWDPPAHPEEMISRLTEIGFSNVQYEYYFSPEVSKIAWFAFDLVHFVGRQIYFYYNDELAKRYEQLVNDKFAMIISADRQLCAEQQQGDYVFYKATK